MKKKTFFKKFTSIALAAVLSVTSLMPVSASDLTMEQVNPTATEQMETTVETQAAELETSVNEAATETAEISTEAVVGETEAETETESDYDPYIILLPLESGAKYDVNKEHLSTELSTDGYEILLYEEGEKVDFSVTGDNDFDIVNALENSVYVSKDAIKNGKVSFTMPAIDLAVVFATAEDVDAKTENVKDPETAVETEKVTEAPVETEAPIETEIQTEPATETELQTEAVETEAVEETELQTDTAETETVEETELATESQTEVLEEADASFEVPDDNDDIMTEAGYPDCGEVEEFGNVNVWYRDITFDAASYKPYDDARVKISVKDVPSFDWTVDTVNAVRYKCTLTDRPEYFWYADVDFVICADRIAAKAKSDKCDVIMPEIVNQDANKGYNGIVPAYAGETVNGKEYTIKKDDASVDVYSLPIDYDPYLFKATPTDLGGYDCNTVGDYTVIYDISYFTYPEYTWHLKNTVHVVDDTTENGVIVNITSPTLLATFEDGSVSEYGNSFYTKEGRFDFTLSDNNVDVDAEITCTLNGEEVNDTELCTIDGTKVSVNIPDATDGLYVLNIKNKNFSGKLVNGGGWEPVDTALEEKVNELSSETLKEYSEGESPEEFTSDEQLSTYYTKVASKSFSAKLTTGYQTGTNFGGAPNSAETNYATVNVTAIKKELSTWLKEKGVNLDDKLSNYTISCANHSLWGWPVSTGMSCTINAEIRKQGSNTYLNLYTYKSYGSNYQPFAGSKSFSTEPAFVTVKVKKRFRDASIALSTKRVSDLKTTFGVFSDAACTNLITTIKIKSDDEDDTHDSGTTEIDDGTTFWVKETRRIGGCTYNDTVFGPYKGKAGETILVGEGEETTDNNNYIPNDPFFFTGTMFNKTDGSQPLGGAIFKVVYYTNPKSDANAEYGYTWYFKSDSNGKINYDRDHFVSSFNGDESDDLITFADGVTPTLPLGCLYVTEVQAPTGYNIDDTSEHEVELYPVMDDKGEYTTRRLAISYHNGWNGTFVDEKPEGYLEVQKYIDADKTNPNPVNATYSLANAVYSIYSDKACTNKITSMTTNEKGYAKSPAITIENGQNDRTVYVKETSTPSSNGYELDSTVYTVVVKKGESVDSGAKVKSYDKPRTGSVSIDKILDGLSEEDYADAVAKKYLEGIKFTLTHENYKNIGSDLGIREIYTDAKGHGANNDLVFGTWTITEDPATVPDGWKTMTPKTFTISADHTSSALEMDITDLRYYGRIEISKKDADSQNLVSLDEATFKIVDDFGHDVALTVDDEKTTVFRTVNGVIRFEENLAGGKYTLVELTAPNGYQLSPETPFVVKSDNTADIPIEVVCNEKPIMKKVSVTKIDSTTGNHCGAGYEFNIIAAEDIVDGSGSVRTVNGVKLEAEAIVDTIVTNKDGVATSKDLYLGKYYVQECKVGDEGLAINYTKYPVTLEDTEAEDQPMSVEINLPDGPTTLNIYKIDTINENPLKGITFSVVPKDADEDVAQDHSNWYVTDENGEIKVEYLKKNTTYVVKEEATIPGYNLCDETAEFTVDEFGLIDGKDSCNLTFTNQPNEVHISKTDITTGKELPGATLVITDEDGKIVDEWVSTEEEHVIYAMPAGKYTLTEKSSPDEYEVEEAIEFEIKDSMIVQQVVMKDSPYREVEVSKKDLTTSEELPGASLVIKDAANNVVDEWVSTTETHKIKLHSGKYTLTETKPADGYVTAATIEFEVIKTTNEDYAVMPVEMKDDVTKITVSKQDITNTEELPGAHLIITDTDGNTVDEWTSTEEPHYIEKLPIGKYTLTEITAPENYELAESVEFEITDTAEIQHVEMFDSPYRDVEVSKKDLTTSEELPGAELTILDSEEKVVESWVSTEEVHKVKLASGKYTLVEKKPADGYVTAESVEFEVLKRVDNGDIEVQQVEMFDDVTKVEISKQDITNEKELPGATLVIEDSDGKKVEEWVSENKPHYIEKLPIGDYTLTEKTAPNGYEVAETVKFSIGDTDVIQHVTMYDSPTPSTSKVSTPKTGDDLNVRNVAMIVAIVIVLLGAGFIFIKKKPAKKEDDDMEDSDMENSDKKDSDKE